MVTLRDTTVLMLGLSVLATGLPTHLAADTASEHRVVAEPVTCADKYPTHDPEPSYLMRPPMHEVIKDLLPVNNPSETALPYVSTYDHNIKVSSRSKSEVDLASEHENDPNASAPGSGHKPNATARSRHPQGHAPVPARTIAKLNYQMAIKSKNTRRTPYGSPDYDDDTWIVLVNATPYRWRRGFIHQYQMKKWLKDWPEYIEPGQTVSAWVRPSLGWFNWADSAAEVEYHLQGTSQPMSFMTKFSNHGKGSVNVEFRGHISSLNNEPHSVHKLGFHRFPGGSGFVLAGTEGHFITNDPPLNWMQAMLPELGDLPLREIVLPRSHHSGLWKSVKPMGFGQWANTQTNSISLRDQLREGGIRVLDFRPVRKWREFRAGHGSKLAGVYHGMLGASLGEMIDMVNEFNREVPGELIIWDVHPTEAVNGDHGFRPFNKKDRERLYKKFMDLEHRLNMTSEDEDITQWPLGKFIGNRTSAVILNVDETWRGKDQGETFPGGQEGFVTGRNFPLTHRWSDTSDTKAMIEDQVRHFKGLRPSRDKPIHVADWLLTQQGAEVVFPSDSILDMARPTWHALYADLWRESTSESYPNWVAVDNIQGNQHKSILMAMNHCLVAKLCGPLDGKVKIEK